MRRIRRLLALFLSSVFICGLMAIPAMARVTHTDGLEIKITMDKEEYNADEPITATIVVKNVRPIPVTVTNIEQLIPEGYALDENSRAALKDTTLKSNESVTLTVTLLPESDFVEEEEEDFFTKLIEGETWGMSNLLLAVLAALAIIIFMILT